MKLRTLILIAVAVTLIPGIYIATQEPKVWCDRQWAGLALYKGGYRSWTLTFCDGFVSEGGKLHPIVITKVEPPIDGVASATIRKGYHWPKYQRADLKRMGILPPTK